jgi:hypothetical protein
VSTVPGLRMGLQRIARGVLFPALFSCNVLQKTGKNHPSGLLSCDLRWVSSSSEFDAHGPATSKYFPAPTSGPTPGLNRYDIIF